MPFADISFGLYPPFKGREERKQKMPLPALQKEAPPPGAPPGLPSLHPHAPPTVSPLSGCSSGLSCLLVHSREAAEIKSACYHLADVQKLDLKKILRGHCCHLLPLAPEQICSGFSQHSSSTWAGCPQTVGASRMARMVFC